NAWPPILQREKYPIAYLPHSPADMLPVCELKVVHAAGIGQKGSFSKASKIWTFSICLLH
ncbi:MAG: hypothetical protein JSV38_08950, partial [Desulfobacterales bacterium]